MESLADIRVQRYLREAGKEIVKKSVITFVDASLKAYEAVAYLHCEYEDTTVSCRLISSKIKVAPLKPISVPRLELMAAVLGRSAAVNAAYREHSRSIDGHRNVLLRQQ